MKGRLLTLGVVLALGTFLFVGWYLREGRSTGNSGDLSHPVLLEADLPRYEAAGRPFTVRFSAKTARSMPGDIYLFLLSNIPLTSSPDAEGTMPLPKGQKFHYAGHSSVESPFPGLRLKAKKEGDSWVAEAKLTLQEIGPHPIAYWFATDGLWGNEQLRDNVPPEAPETRVFLPILKSFPCGVSKVEVIEGAQKELLDQVQGTQGTSMTPSQDYRTTVFCRMGFGDGPWQLVRTMKDPGSLRTVYYLFGMEKGRVKRELVHASGSSSGNVPRVVNSLAIGKDLLWIEEGQETSAALLGWIDGKAKKVLNHRLEAKWGQGWILFNIFVTKEGVLHAVWKRPSGDGGTDYLLENYDWNFPKRRFDPNGQIRQATYAQYLIESGDYQDFLSQGFNRPNFESLLEYFTNVNNEGSTRNGIHNLLVTASGTDYGEDKAAWRKWFEAKAPQTQK